jgi:hypothetical protein
VSQPSNTRVQRTRSSASPLRSPLTRRPLGRESRWLAFVAVAVGLCLASCARSRDIPVSSLPPELTVPQGATDVVARSDGRAAAVEYRMSVPYPAEGFLAEVAARLNQNGWKAAETDLLNPTIASSSVRGWTSYVDGRVSPRVGVHQWLADWRNREGEVVSYALRYSSAADDPTRKPPPPSNSDLHVTAFLIPAQQAKAMAARAKRVGGK